MVHWEHRISPGEHAKARAAFAQFRRSRKHSNDQHQFYDSLCSAGVTPEEADAIINLELEADEEG